MLIIGIILLGAAVLFWLVSANIGRRQQELLDNERFESFRIVQPQSESERKRLAEDEAEDKRLLSADMAAIGKFARLIKFIGMLFFAGGAAALLAYIF